MFIDSFAVALTPKAKGRPREIPEAGPLRHSLPSRDTNQYGAHHAHQCGQRVSGACNQTRRE